MSEKIAISKPNINVGTAVNANDLIFSSDYNTLKYSISGTYAMTTNATTVGTIAHNLGYTPFFTVYVNQFDFPGAGTAEFGLVEYFNLQSPLRAARAYVDNTNLYLSYNAGTVPTYTIQWYYKIFRNNLGL
jgi:hypothetical protein